MAEAAEAGRLLPPGSAEEQAARSAATAVTRLLAGLLSEAAGKDVKTLEVGYFALWSADRQASGRHHLTLTTAS